MQGPLVAQPFVQRVLQLINEITVIIYNYLDVVGISPDRAICWKGILDISN
jgi:hypothetical protein